MRMKTRGFLLFGFAFASVLSSSEVLTSSRSTSLKLVQPLATDVPSAILKEFQKQAVDHDLKKRAIEIYQQSVYPKMGGDNKDNGNAFDTDKKRESRFRFTGMRGKKDYESKYIESYPASGLDKTESPGDKKTEDELYEGKRAPLTFFGMRGKKLEDLDSGKFKSEPSDLNSLSTIQRYLYNNGLMDDANASELDYFEDVVTKQDKKEWDSNAFSKKSPYSFQGSNGRKNSLYDYKRALGFMGMRGKKDAEMWSRYYGYKRVPQSSFFGMKGLHEPSSYLFQDGGLLDKMKEDESPRNRFRREIWPSNSKKKNSFYVVRGKKSTDERSQNQLYYTKE